MSQWRGRIDDIEEPGDVAELVGEYYQIPSVIVLLAFMLWTRVRSWEKFVVDGTVFFGGNDPWYHYRMTSYTVQNWPQTAPFDPWTYFPYGTNSGQFGTVMDQIVATIALVVGLGSPSDHTVRMVALFAPALFGVATAVPMYVIGRRTSNRFAGVVAVTILAVVPTAFMSRGVVGSYDHHVAEAFFQTLAVLAVMVAVSVAETEKPVWELFRARDIEAVRRPVGWALIAGFALALYVWTWPPGVFLLGIVGTFFLVQLTSEYAHGESPEHLAIAGAISLSTAGVLTLAALESFGFSATNLTLLQPFVAFVVAGGCVFLAWLAREWDARDLPNLQYPVAVGAILVVGAGLFAVVLPGLFSYFVDQVLRVIGLDATPTARTISEAQAMPFDELYDSYKFTIYIALAGVAYVFSRHFWEKPRAEMTLIAVWVVFTLLAALTQTRFDYYLTLSVTAMTALVVGQFVDFTGLLEFDSDVETYQLLTIVAIVLVVFAPIVYPMAMNDSTNPDSGVMYMSESGPNQALQPWNEHLDWMDDNTPEEGNYGGAGNDMPYYGTFDRTDDFDYDEGFYGVLSWWDYGHWITAMGDRIPIANPFQQGANEAANFLLATNESQANDVVGDLSDGENSETRYVMVDWKMTSTESFFRTQNGAVSLGSKYGAPFQFYDAGNISSSDYYESQRVWYRSQTGYQPLSLRKQPYYESTAVRLYNYHGSAVEAQPVVFDWDIENPEGQSGQIPVSNGTRVFDSMEEAREYADDDPTAQVGGFGKYPEERVQAMENYRLVGASERSALQSSRYQAAVQKQSRGILQQALRTQNGLNGAAMNQLHATDPNWVKTFERVSGSTVEGEGPANTTVEATVEMQMPGSSSTFDYTQRATTDENGEFTMTVPYSTTGYDQWGTDEGYTNTSVRATGPYEVDTVLNKQVNDTEYTFNGTVDVSEGQVLGEDDSASSVELTRHEVSNETASGDGADGNESTDGDGTDAGSDGTETTDNGTAPTDDGNASNGTDDNDTQRVKPVADADPTTALSLAGVGIVGVAAAFRRR